MKNTRRYRLTAILLAAVMVLGIVTPASGASTVYTMSGPYVYYATQDAGITFASDGQTVGSVADLVPNKASTMTISVPGGNALPPNKNGETLIDVPQYVVISSADAAACQSSTVNCTYNYSTNQLSFQWKGAAYQEQGFTATIPITPDVPATVDVSGRHLIVTVKANQTQIGALKAQSRADSRLVTTAINTYNGKFCFDDNNAHVWTFNHISGDWYTISNGSYLRMDKNALSLTDKANATIFHIRNEANGYVIESNGYYLNTKSDNAANGMQGSNWSPMAQWVKLYSPSDIFIPTEGDQGYIKLSNNGGNATIQQSVLAADIGKTITLPGYSGQKNGKKFIGWARYSNIYEKHDGSDSSYCEVFLPGTEMEVSAGIATLYAVFEEKGTDVRFGFRIDGNIPHEPSNYSANEYTGHVTVKNALKIGRWVVDVSGDEPIVGNHVNNDVATSLLALPSDEEIKATMKNKYDPETMYIHWYVLKYSGQWKVDGVIRNRTAKSVAYDINLTSSDRNKIEKMPKGFEYGQKATITVGAEKDGKVITPVLDGYEFLGWNSKADGTGTAYEEGKQIEVTDNITFYAQWREIPKYEVTYVLNNAGKNTEIPAAALYQEDGIVELPEAEDRDGYIFSGWTVNGSKIEGNSFEMPAEPVEVEGTYYGPINVRIRSDWNGDEIGLPGSKIVLTAVPECSEDLDYDFQWFYKDGDEWIKVPGVTGDTVSYELDETTSGRTWRVVVTNVRLHQD